MVVDKDLCTYSMQLCGSFYKLLCDMFVAWKPFFLGLENMYACDYMTIFIY